MTEAEETTYETVMRARMEYEISDSSRDGPLVHRRAMRLMEALKTEADRQIADDPARTAAITEAAQRGRQALVLELTGATTEQEIDAWLDKVEGQ